MHGCILGLRSVAYHFQVSVTLTLTSDLETLANLVRAITGAPLHLHSPNLMYGFILGLRSVMHHFQVSVTLTLTSDLELRKILSGP